MSEKTDLNVMAIRSRRWGCIAKAAATVLVVGAALTAAGSWWAAHLFAQGREHHATALRFALHLRALQTIPAEGDNAAAPFVKACRLYVRPADASLESPVRDATLDFSSAPVQSWLNDNAPCRGALAAALELPGCDWGSDYRKGLAGLASADPADLRRATRLLEVAARAEAAAGRPGPALNQAALILRLAGTIAGRRSAADSLVSAGIEEAFVRALQGVLNSCDPSAEDLRRIETPIAGHLGRRSPAAEAVEREALLVRVSIGRVASRDMGTGDFAAAMQSRGRLVPEATGLGLAWWRWSGRLLDDDGLVDQMTHQAVAALNRPYPQVLDAAALLDRRLRELPGWALACRGMFPPRYAEAAVRDGEALAAMRGARLMVALRMRRLSKGDYPDGALSVQDTPEDPFSGRAFGCRRTEAGCLLWSVGPDRLDDNGTERKDILFELKR